MNDFTTDPCPACKPNTVCRTPSCGRLKSKQQEPFIQKKQAEPVAWLSVKGFEDYYEISSEGVLRSKSSKKCLAQNKIGKGYIKADLWANGKRKQTSLHRLVAETFIGPIGKGFEVNHKNGVKSDNRVHNLEIVSKRQNEQHSRYLLKNLVKTVVATNLDTSEQFLYPSIESTKQDGFLPSCVYKCCYQKRKSHKGFSFKFEDSNHADHKKAVKITHPAPAVAQPPDVQQPVVIVTGTRHVICQCEKCKIAAPAVAVNEILPSLPEPALQGNAGECCGNHTTGGEYMGQSESICCGQFEEYVPDYYTAEQMREYARAAIAAAQQGKGE